MDQDRRLVYSTEHGALEKPMRSQSKKRKQPPATAAIKKNSKQGVRIRRESKGRGGKCVSIVDGLPLDEKSLKVLLKKFKTQLGSGGAVKGGCMEIQGEHREKLLLLLEKEGYRAKISGG